MKIDDEIVELKERDAVRVPAGTWRGFEAGPEGLEILVVGAPKSRRRSARRRRWPARLMG
jgi:mannose-6-phosphate isomerase-like protein (cupin superfamily)